jgi:PAS domain S-box-containing protein
MIMAIVTALAIIMHQQVTKTGHQENLASHIAQGANELSYLANDYLIYGESQQLRRWQSRFASFSGQVASLDVEKPEQQVLVGNIQENQKRLKEVFDSVASAPGSPSRDRAVAYDSALFQVSWSRMAVQSQALISDASRLSRLLDQQKGHLTETRTIMMYSMVCLFGLFLLASYRLTYRRILKSISKLQAGAAVIGSGNLDFKIEEKKNDEIGDLSHAFNQMTTNLEVVTASKADLEREVTQRKQAEEDLRRQREWLRVTLSSIGDAVIASDTQGRVTFFNPVAETLTGWQTEEALRQQIQDIFRIINEKTHEPAGDLVARVLNEKRVVGLANDTALVTKDGRKIPIEDSAAPIKDSTGALIGAVLVFHDVTQKRRAQEALRRSEARYRSYIELTEQLGWTTNPEGEVTEDIPAWRRFTGQGEEQVKGWGWSKALHPDDLEQTVRVWRNAVETKSRYETEYRIRRHNGVYRHFLARGVPVFEENGNLREWVGTCIDITEHKLAELALHESREDLNRAQAVAHTGSWRLDIRHDELVWSDETYRIFGIPGGTPLTYETFLAAIHPEDRTHVDRKWQAALRGEPYDIEHRIVVGNTVKWVRERAELEFDKAGSLLGGFGTVQDITKAKEAEQKIREIHERAVWLARFPDENPNPVLRASADGSVLYCNSASREKHGWTCRVGQTLSDPLPPLLKQALTEGKEIQRDLELGGKFYSVTVSPFPEEGYANVYGHDVTERKDAEEILRQRTFELQQLTETLEQRVMERTEELAAANKALRQLSIRLLSAQEEERKRIAGEIHDTLGACLGAIKFKVEGYLYDIRKIPGVESESLNTLLPVIQEGVEECRRIQMDLRPSMLDDLGLFPTLSWFCRRFQTIYSAIRIDQEIEILEDDVPQPLKIVAFRITQEALNNIAKHSHADFVLLSLLKKNGRIELTIQDNGRGFDPEKAPGSESTLRGLGLTSMKERTELSGGSFDIQSAEGKGTIIRAMWPL